jgi:hypothetical protein
MAVIKGAIHSERLTAVPNKPTVFKRAFNELLAVYWDALGNVFLVGDYL